MQRVIAHGVRDAVEELGDLLVRLVLHVSQHGFDQVRLVAAAGFDYKFAGGCALVLETVVSLVHDCAWKGNGGGGVPRRRTSWRYLLGN